MHCGNSKEIIEMKRSKLAISLALAVGLLAVAASGGALRWMSIIVPEFSID